MGEIESILGIIKVQRDRSARTITMSQHSFIEEAREKYQARSYEPVTNLIKNKGIDVNINTDASRRLSTFEAKKFKSLVGTLNWLALWTASAVSYHLLRYLWWTAEEKGVTLGGPLNLTPMQMLISAVKDTKRKEQVWLRYLLGILSNHMVI